MPQKILDNWYIEFKMYYFALYLMFDTKYEKFKKKNRYLIKLITTDNC